MRAARRLILKVSRLAPKQWEPSDGDTRCQSCGFPNIAWWAESDLWNAVMGTEDNPTGDGHVLCPTCFLVRVNEYIAKVRRADRERIADYINSGTRHFMASYEKAGEGYSVRMSGESAALIVEQRETLAYSIRTGDLDD